VTFQSPFWLGTCPRQAAGLLLTACQACQCVESRSLPARSWGQSLGLPSHCLPSFCHCQAIFPVSQLGRDLLHRFGEEAPPYSLSPPLHPQQKYKRTHCFPVRCISFFETGSCSVAPTGLELTILFPLLPKYWNFRHVPPPPSKYNLKKKSLRLQVPKDLRQMLSKHLSQQQSFAGKVEMPPCPLRVG
jgi:hypothetical protein